MCLHMVCAVDNTVGFRVGSYRNGDISVLEPTACLNITSSMKAIAKVSSHSASSFLIQGCPEKWHKVCCVITFELFV